MVDPFHPFPEWQYEKGLKLMTTHHARIQPQWKTTVYFPAMLAMQTALKKGSHEAVYVDKHGSILEGTTFNVFCVDRRGCLIAPEKGVLPGVTAGCVLQLARQLKIPIKRESIHPETLRTARECFITSSNRELIPAIQVDGRRIGDGRPGLITRELHFAYRRLICQKAGLRLS